MPHSDKEKYKQYQREYQRQWRKRNKDKVRQYREKGEWAPSGAKRKEHNKQRYQQLKNKLRFVPKCQSTQQLITDRTIWSQDCWLWQGPLDHDNYGLVVYDGRTFRTNRFSYCAYKGQIPKGKSVLHTCDNPQCCNPDHLYAGTAADNGRDKVERNRQCRGEQQHKTVITEQDVKEIRVLSATTSQAELSRRYGIHTTTTYNIVNKITWKHV